MCVANLGVGLFALSCVVIVYDRFVLAVLANGNVSNDGNLPHGRSPPECHS